MEGAQSLATARRHVRIIRSTTCPSGKLLWSWCWDQMCGFREPQAISNKGSLTAVTETAGFERRWSHGRRRPVSSKQISCFLLLEILCFLLLKILGCTPRAASSRRIEHFRRAVQKDANAGRLGSCGDTICSWRYVVVEYVMVSILGRPSKQPDESSTLSCHPEDTRVLHRYLKSREAPRSVSENTVVPVTWTCADPAFIRIRDVPG